LEKNETVIARAQAQSDPFFGGAVPRFERVGPGEQTALSFDSSRWHGSQTVIFC